MDIQEKYIMLVGQYLDRFTVKGDGTYNFRCPYCHDSKKSKIKCRGYIYLNKANYEFKCHNCGVVRTITNFLKDIAYPLYSDYMLEAVSRKYPNSVKAKKPVITPSKPLVGPFEGLHKLSTLSPTHAAVSYVRKRKIPSLWMEKLYYAEDFMEWVAKVLPEKANAKIHESRLIIPFFDENGIFIGGQGRSLDPKIPDHLRYMSVAVDKTKPQIFGLDTLNRTRRFYVFEGPFDSMFIPNSIGLTGATKHLTDDENAVYVLDNEARNPDIVKQYRKLIDAGKTVFIWPWVSDKKEDINDLVLKGMLISDVKKLIDENAKNGMYAQLKFSDWKRV